MSAILLYRISSIVFLVFAVGHTAGFLTFRPAVPEGMAVYEAMRSVHFDLSGSLRSYDDICTGFGLTVSVYMLFCAYLSWHLGWLAHTQPRAIGTLAWVFAAVQLICMALSVRFFFLVPMVFSGAIVVCLLGAAWKLRERSDRAA